MHYYELVGLPGTGKTTALRALRRSGIVRNVEHVAHEVMSSRSKIGALGSRALQQLSPELGRRLDGGPQFRAASEFIDARPDMAFTWLDAIRSVDHPTRRKTLYRLTFTSFANYAYLDKHADTEAIVMVDEGLAQRAAALIDLNTDPDILASGFPPVAGIVYLEAEDALSLQRCTQRGDSNPERTHARRSSIDAFVARIGADVLRISADSPREMLVHRIARHIKKTR